MKLPGISEADAREARRLAGLEHVPGPMVSYDRPAPVSDAAPAEDEAPTLAQDPQPGRQDDLTRAERREPRGIGHLDLPWRGPIPNVGRSIHRLRAAWRGRAGRRGMPWRTPVKVDVVPAIHQRAARGSWSARWSGAHVITRLSHRTYTAVTAVDGAVASLTLISGRIVTAGRGTLATRHERPPEHWTDCTVIDPTRGPTAPRPGALACLALGPP